MLNEFVRRGCGVYNEISASIITSKHLLGLNLLKPNDIYIFFLIY